MQEKEGEKVELGSPIVAEQRTATFEELVDVDRHWKVIGETNNGIETVVIDARKEIDLLHERTSGRPSGRKQIAIGLVEHIGDIVACEPVARYLREKDPEAEISWVVKERHRELIDYNPHRDYTISVNCLSDWMRLSEANLYRRYHRLTRQQTCVHKPGHRAAEEKREPPG